MMMPGLTLNEDHQYAFYGRPLTGVTSLIQDEGLMDMSWSNDEAMARGKAVHEAIHYLNENDLDWETLDPRILPYVRAYEKFTKQAKIETLACELSLCSERYGIAGTLDWLGWYNDKFTLLDFKSGVYSAWQEIQLELYRRLVAECGLALGIDQPIEQCYIVTLAADESYKVHTSRKLRMPQIDAAVNSILNLNLLRREIAA